MATYSERAAKEFGGNVTYWTTLNEPNVYAYQCYLNGVWLAQKKDPLAMLRVLKNGIRAHAAMYRAIKNVAPKAQVSYAHHWRVFDPLNPNSPLDRFAAGSRSQVINNLFFSAVHSGVLEFPLGLNSAIPEAKGTQDYFGVNYYYQEFTAFDISKPGDVFARSVYNPDTERLQHYFEGTANLDADAFCRLLTKLGTYKKPIFITENGYVETDQDDQVRYMVTHLDAVQKAIRGGADIRGYFWWSLLDNFEWSEGYTPRFGLYHTDFETQARTLKKAGQVYKQIVDANGIPDELLKEYGREK
jgi:beta-glucosidase